MDPYTITESQYSHDMHFPIGEAELYTTDHYFV